MPIIGVVLTLVGIIMMFAIPNAMNKKEEKKTALEEMQN
jgi:type II secretory pathway pseudopilin PulG